MPEFLVILVIIFIIFGAGKLPEIGTALGKGIQSFKKATRTPDVTWPEMEYKDSLLHPRIISAVSRLKNKFKTTNSSVRFIGLPLFMGVFPPCSFVCKMVISVAMILCFS